jgi:hypothetical protein
VLLAREITRNDDVDFRTVERSFADDRYAPELTEMLRQVEAIRIGSIPLESPSTRRFVAWKYGTLLGATWALREWFPGWTTVSYLALERPPIRRDGYRRLLASALREVPVDSPLRRTIAGRRLSRLSRGGLWVGRVAYRLTLTLLLGLVAWYVRYSIGTMIDTD